MSLVLKYFPLTFFLQNIYCLLAKKDRKIIRPSKSTNKNEELVLDKFSHKDAFLYKELCYKTKAFAEHIAGSMNLMDEMSPEELSSKGKGGMRQMHNYVSISHGPNYINTPPDTYRPDKLSNSVTIENLQKLRDGEIPMNNKPAFSI